MEQMVFIMQLKIRRTSSAIGMGLYRLPPPFCALGNKLETNEEHLWDKMFSFLTRGHPIVTWSVFKFSSEVALRKVHNSSGIQSGGCVRGVTTGWDPLS